MKYAIVFSSRTGNTQQLAQALRDALPQEDCLYFGPPDPAALQAPVLFVGFWTDKGSCDSDTAAFLEQLDGQTVFLFGTAGFGGTPAYFASIQAAAQKHLPASVKVAGAYLCQGKMPLAVRRRYEAMEDSPRRTMMLENFDRALSHPDQADLDGLTAAVRAAHPLD